MPKKTSYLEKQNRNTSEKKMKKKTKNKLNSTRTIELFIHPVDYQYSLVF